MSVAGDVQSRVAACLAKELLIVQDLVRLMSRTMSFQEDTDSSCNFVSDKGSYSQLRNPWRGKTAILGPVFAVWPTSVD